MDPFPRHPVTVTLWNTCNFICCFQQWPVICLRTRTSPEWEAYTVSGAAWSDLQPRHQRLGVGALAIVNRYVPNLAKSVEDVRHLPPDNGKSTVKAAVSPGIARRSKRLAVWVRCDDQVAFWWLSAFHRQGSNSGSRLCWMSAGLASFNWSVSPR